MPSDALLSRPLASPFASLAVLCAIWKIVLFVVALSSPGPGYDTSTILLFGTDAASSIPLSASLGSRLAVKLTRWDAIYFAKLAQRGHVYEQEWAFSWGFARLMAKLAAALPTSEGGLTAQALSGICIANVAHLLSVLVLYRLVTLMLPDPSERKTAFLTALLHVLSPAGLFLMAPYAESLFSLLSFVGMLCYCYTTTFDGTSAVMYCLSMLASGASFGLAAVLRGNGLLNGIIFAYGLISHLASISRGEALATAFRRIICTILAGCLVGVGFILPQWIAYQRYCLEESGRPWCSRIPPSIYTWVQEQYWNVGFLRYWTLSNVPLFLLAAPTLWALLTSAQRVILRKIYASDKGQPTAALPHDAMLLFALPQLALAALALTNFHVQIINRVSSGYPLWYMAIAGGLNEKSQLHSLAIAPKHKSNWILRLMIIYSVVQGGLFASFLPPA
ncbi:glycosyltransferase family 76 protein [Aplosporella prunicola CBS 121167]|uniref:GPI mannosyltransferase 2 n=1 Tax=Aplosporella prunicola CBS 121167 TaxID=1176127 RepID=A0A6A6B0Q7_9PEZI|nr:glycosyltransferase family 76 protein [Aplosporella prunicola CBS 121167]KAF2137013.1 glycosyltransferase family 76 protein [Aplosporella prunicola CBS 121167]